MLFYSVFYATRFTLRSKKIPLPWLPRFAYFLILLLGFPLLVTFLPYSWLFFKKLFYFKFFVILNDTIKVSA